VNNLISSMEYQQDLIDRALEVFEGEKARLYLSDGRRKYSDEEHRRRYSEALGKMSAVVEAAQDRAREALEAAEKALEALYTDPSAWLTTEELANANARAPFVREDAQSLPIPVLTQRGKIALESGDKIAIWLLARYATERANATRDALQRGEQVESEGLTELYRVAEQLREAAIPAKVREKAQTAGKVREKAQQLRAHAGHKMRLADGSESAAREETARYYASTF
jgi:hypothetical protein